MLQNVAEFYCVEAEIHGYTHQFWKIPLNFEKRQKRWVYHIAYFKSRHISQDNYLIVLLNGLKTTTKEKYLLTRT